MRGKLTRQRSENRFEDFKKPYSEGQALAEANRCLYCHDAPCITACPTEVDVPEFIRRISSGNLLGAARTILEANVLGMSCARVCPVEVLCAGECVFNEMGSPPIQIGKLQRFATDAALEEGWPLFEAGPDSGKSVGLVGGGPASLAAAHALRRRGHACTIYERRQVLGGLNTWGVAPYKMRADKSVEEVDWLLSIGGIDVKLGAAVGDEPGWGDLAARHDALFLGFGLGEDRWLHVPGADLPEVEGAVSYIERMKLGQVDTDRTTRAVVVGGGNTAVDAVRELIGLGFTDVMMLYRGDEASMTGYEHEWNAAKVAGARVKWRVLPEAFEGAGRLQRVRCARLDEARRPLADEELSVDAGLALIAIGQSPLTGLVADLEGIEARDGKLAVDQRGATGRPGVFAGGDCANGGKEVVNAVAEGELAAEGIHEYLKQGGDNA